MHKRIITFAALAALLAPTICGVKTRTLAQVDESACQRWVDSVYNSLTLRERVAQLIVAQVVPTQGETSKAAIRRYVQTNGVGGMLFSSGSLDNFREVISYTRSVSKVPILITFDGEWGLSMRIEDMPKFPDNMTIGAISDTNLVYEYGREMARECRLVGINVNFAPVLDVNSNPNNPVIGKRSYGMDPERVANLGAAYSRGLEDGGILSVGKHFPGHGDTSTDSHKESTIVTHTNEQMHNVDLVPFKRYVDSGLSGIMTGHIVVPSLDSSKRPASLSHKMTTELLRNELGFDGLIYTDALGMQGAHVNGKNSVVLALQAGADMLLAPSKSTIEDIDVLMSEIKAGRISQATIEDRCKRVLRYKYALLVAQENLETDDNTAAKICTPKAEALINQMACKAVTVLRNTDNVLPIGNLANNRIAVVTISGGDDPEFVDMCRKYAKVDVYNIGDNTISNATLNEIRNHDVVIAAVYSDASVCRHAFSQLSNMPNLVSVFLMNPYKADKFSSILGSSKAIVLGYENIPATRRATAMAVFGGIEVSGKLPVDLEKLAPLGAGLHIEKSRLGYSSPVAEGMKASLTDSIDSIVENAIATKAVPGCQVLVAHNGNVVIDKCYGLQTAGGDPVTPETLYDLASVSKAVGTLPGVMKAYDLGLFKLDDCASSYIPGLRNTGKDDITIRQLLYHESGMPAALNMYLTMMDTTTYTAPLIVGKRDDAHPEFIMRGAYGSSTARLRTDILSKQRSDLFPNEAAKDMWVGQAAVDTIMGRIYNIGLRKNKNYTYSCLNFCLLMDLEQRVTGQSHDQWVADSIWAPLGAYDACYRPTLSHKLANIAPTEKDTYLRRQLVHGYVHDETAAMLGGVSGNAGVFATATDLAKICQMWLNGGKYGDVQVLSPETVDLFLTSKTPNSRRGLGFDKPDKVNERYSPTCEEADASVVGHTGFTGTAFWIDPKNDLIYIILCNRVNPTRDNDNFSKANLRPGIFTQVYNSLN